MQPRTQKPYLSIQTFKKKIEPTVHEYSYFTVFHILGEVAAGDMDFYSGKRALFGCAFFVLIRNRTKFI